MSLALKITTNTDKIVKILAILTIITTIIAIYTHHSIVPYYDMWDGYVGFYLHSQNTFMAWWGQHNEHRFVLTRLFIWLDIRYFAGLGWFLSVVNFIFALMIVFVVNLFLNEKCKQIALKGKQKTIATYFIVSLTLFWSQKNNFISPFETHFFLVNLLPLVAFYGLHKFTMTNNKQYYAGALVCGIFCPLAMANGIVLLPLIAIYMAVSKKNLSLIFIPLVLAAIVTALYFTNYHTLPSDSNITKLLNNPLGILHYVALYIANPFYYLIWRGPIAANIVGIFGYIYMLVIIMAAYKILFKEKLNSLHLSLLFIIVFIGASALATAFGRIEFGSGQALTSRYSTAALLLWVTLLILNLNIISDDKAIQFKKIGFSITVFLIFSVQIESLVPNGNQFRAHHGGLMAQLGVKDPHAILSIYPRLEPTLSYTKSLQTQNLSFTAQFPFKNIHERLGKIEPAQKLCSHCLYSVTSMQKIEGEGKFMTISGVYFDSETNSYPLRIEFFTENHQNIGFALNGSTVKLNHQGKSYKSFAGYILAGFENSKFYAIGVSAETIQYIKN